MTRWTLPIFAILGSLFAAPMAEAQPDRPVSISIQTADGQKHYFGWAGPEKAAREFAKFGDQVQTYRASVANPPVIENRVVRLSDFAKMVNGGKHLPTRDQEVGDCVSQGVTTGLDHSAAARMAILGVQANGPFIRAFQPYVYGISRVQIGGGRLSGDGSLGIWAAKGCVEYGAAAETDPGVPPYSGTVSRTWGRQGPPKALIDIAKGRTIDARLVTTFTEACQAIAGGNAVPVCSDRGFRMRAVERNGRLEGIPEGDWPHCMCFTAFDTRPGKRGLYCQNSWGPDAHAPAEDYARLDDMPPGGFWVTEAVANAMLKQGDSYAYSFDGFQTKNLFGWRKDAWEQSIAAYNFDRPKAGLPTNFNQSKTFLFGGPSDAKTTDGGAGAVVGPNGLDDDGEDADQEHAEQVDGDRQPATANAP